MPDVLTLHVDRLDTPIGTLVLAADEAGRLRMVDWHDYEARWRLLLRRHYGHAGVALSDRANASGITSRLRAYFEGDIGAINGLTVATGGTPFQREVWTALRTIAAGRTLSYAALARTIGRPAAVRAVGLANGANPIGIVVPCHRVVGSDGSLTGYGGGLERKQWLLAHEARR